MLKDIRDWVIFGFLARNRQSLKPADFSSNVKIRKMKHREKFIRFKIKVISRTLIYGFMITISFSSVEAKTKPIDVLLKLAREEFGKLSSVEEKVLRSIVKGTVADFSSKLDNKNNPEKWKDWGDNRTIKASFLTWLCTTKKVSEFVSKSGITIQGLLIQGPLQLGFAKIDFPLALIKCAIPNKIYLLMAELITLCLSGSYTGPITADGLNVKGPLYLRNGFKANGEVRLVKATIGGDIYFSGGHFSADQKGKKGKSKKNVPAIDAAGIVVKGSVAMKDEFIAKGEVRLISAKISGALNCEHGTFINIPNSEDPKAVAINAKNIIVDGDVYLSGRFNSKGEVQFIGAKIGGAFNCDKGTFINNYLEDKNDEKAENINCAIHADGMSVGRSLYMRDGFTALGKVRLLSAKISDQFSCSNARIISKDIYSLIADRIEVKKDVFLNNGFEAKGEVRFLGGTIHGNFDCSKGSFTGRKNKLNNTNFALNADGLNVGGSIFLRNNFIANGTVWLLGASIGGSINCQKGHFINAGASAIQANRVIVNDNVFLRNEIEINGKIDFSEANVGGSYVYEKVASPDKVIIELRRAKIGTLRIDKKSWPKEGNLQINGLTYNRIETSHDLKIADLVDWIRLQPNLPFKSQPYEQLSVVLKNEGYENEAKEILIKKNQDIGSYRALRGSDWVWYKVLGPLIGFGYDPLGLIKWVIGIFIFFGYLVFKIGHKYKLIIRCENSEIGSNESKSMTQKQPTFNALIYSIDTFVPLINFKHSKYWLPVGVCSWYFWIHTFLGWLLCTFIIIGLTGIIKT